MGQERGRRLEGGLHDPDAVQLFGRTKAAWSTSSSLLLHAPGRLGHSSLPPAQLLHLALQPLYLGLQLGP